MDKRFVTWFWFNADVTTTTSTGRFRKLLAERLREQANRLETGQGINVSPAGNVSDAMGTPLGYFETVDEAKKYTR